MPLDSNWYYKSATELLTALKNKEVSAVELLTATIARIERLDKTINALVVRDFTRAYEEAIAADTAIAKGKQYLLLGLPMSVKESFSVAGLPTTWGNPVYKDWYPAEDALAIQRLKTAGAIIIGKTNIPFMLKDWQSYNDIYGTTNNPWDVRLTPGGSSGGSAAALATGYVALELGSDLAGSLRAPAHFCGVFAHKPSINLIPTRGGQPFAVLPSPKLIDLAVTGPMARSAADLSLALEVLAGPDESLYGKGYKLFLPPPRHFKLQDFRILVFDTHPLYPTDDRIQKAIVNLVTRLNDLNLNIAYQPKDTPDLAKITQTYATMLGAFISASLPLDIYQKSQANVAMLDSNDHSLHSYVERGCIANHRDWLIAMDVRENLRQEWQKLYRQYDVIICPVMPTLAFPHNHTEHSSRKMEINGIKVPYGDQFVWSSIATLFGLPSTVMPIGQVEGLPVGVQIIGDFLEDRTTIEFARLLEKEIGGFVAPEQIY